MTFREQSLLTLGLGLALASPIIAANLMPPATIFTDLGDVLSWILLGLGVLGTLLFMLGLLRIWGVVAFHVISPSALFSRSRALREWRAACAASPFMRWLWAIDEFGKDFERNV
jgi:hypothetical protein